MKITKGNWIGDIEITGQLEFTPEGSEGPTIKIKGRWSVDLGDAIELEIEVDEEESDTETEDTETTDATTADTSTETTVTDETETETSRSSESASSVSSTATTETEATWRTGD